MHTAPKFGVTVQQPWAGMVAAADWRFGAQHFTRGIVRDKPLPMKLVGRPIAIRAGHRNDTASEEALAAYDVKVQWDPRLITASTAQSAIVAVGVLVAHCRLANTTTDARLVISAGLTQVQARWACEMIDPHHWAWVVDLVTTLDEPIPCRFVQRDVFDLPADVHAQLTEQLAARHRLCTQEAS